MRVFKTREKIAKIKPLFYKLHIFAAEVCALKAPNFALLLIELWLRTAAASMIQKPTAGEREAHGRLSSTRVVRLVGKNSSFRSTARASLFLLSFCSNLRKFLSYVLPRIFSAATMVVNIRDFCTQTAKLQPAFGGCRRASASCGCFEPSIGVDPFLHLHARSLARSYDRRRRRRCALLAARASPAASVDVACAKNQQPILDLCARVFVCARARARRGDVRRQAAIVTAAEATATGSSFERLATARGNVKRPRSSSSLDYCAICVCSSVVASANLPLVFSATKYQSKVSTRKKTAHRRFFAATKFFSCVCACASL